MHSRFISCLSVFLFIIISLAQANPVKEKFEAGMLAFGNKEFNKAITLYEETLKLYPKLGAAYNFMAMSYKELGSDSAKIESLLKKAIEVEPTYAASYDNLAKHYYSMGSFELARENGLKAVELAPNSITAKLSLAWTYLLGLAQPEEAVVYFKQVTEEAQLPYAYFGLGMAYYMDDQRILVMDMITKLRDIGEENFAQQLEGMVRDGNYDRALAGQPLLKPKVNKAILVTNDLPSLADVSANKNMPVRIRKELSVKTVRTKPTATTGADRIRALQDNYQSKGSGY